MYSHGGGKVHPPPSSAFTEVVTVIDDELITCISLVTPGC